MLTKKKSGGPRERSDKFFPGGINGVMKHGSGNIQCLS